MADLHSLAPEALERFFRRSVASSSMPPEPDIAGVLRQILDEAAEAVPSEAGAILLDDPLAKSAALSQNTLYFVAAFGPSAGRLMGASIPAGAGAAGHVYATGTPHLSANGVGVPTTGAPRPGHPVRSSIAAPIRLGSTVCGAIELLNRSDDESYDAHDLLLLQVFASYTASSIQNALDARHAQQLARIDDLTGLFNDRYLHVRLREELARAAEEGHACTLLFVDLDHFKQINDRHGHLVGSQVLREVGFLLRRATSEQDVIPARYGGDEFTLIFPAMTAVEAIEIAEGIRRAIAGAVFLEHARGDDLPALRLHGVVTASIGVADTTGMDLRDPEAARALIRRADEAMYGAKAAGKDRFMVSGWEGRDAPHLASPADAP
ncbi:MAG: diguanylate cyclase [Gemmatimonadota bacterium]